MPSSRHFCTVLWLSVHLSSAEPATRTLNDGNLVLSGIPEIPAEIASDLAPYQNVRSAVVLDWSKDGESLFIATRFGEVSQIHRVDQAGGARHQLTFGEEPVGGVRRRPGSEQLIFAMDEGGSEFDQLYLFDPSNGDRRLLTDGESRNRGATWSRDGRLLAFASTRRNGRSNDVWVMSPESPAAATLALEASGRDLMGRSGVFQG